MASRTLITDPARQLLEARGLRVFLVPGDGALAALQVGSDQYVRFRAVGGGDGAVLEVDACSEAQLVADFRRAWPNAAKLLEAAARRRV